MFVYELSGSGFESSSSHLNLRFRTCFEQGVPWDSGNYRVWIHSGTCTWHDKYIQSMSVMFFITLSKLTILWSFLLCCHIQFLLSNQIFASIESIDAILLSSLHLNAIFLTSSVSTFCFSLLNLCWFYMFLYINFIFFLLNVFHFQDKLLLSNFHNLQN